MIQEQSIKPEISGAIKSFIYILKFYHGPNFYYSLDPILDHFDHSNCFSSLEKIAAEYKIIAVHCTNISIDELKKCKYPTIINISSDPNKKHYVVCFGFNLENGFLIIDFLISRYYVNENVLKTLWQDQICWAFVF